MSSGRWCHFLQVKYQGRTGSVACTQECRVVHIGVSFPNPVGRVSYVASLIQSAICSAPILRLMLVSTVDAPRNQAIQDEGEEQEECHSRRKHGE